jgi:hypothetical protein
MERNEGKITRDILRTLRDGDAVTVECQNGYDLDSQRNTAYAMQRMLLCRFECRTQGLRLTVTRRRGLPRSLTQANVKREGRP